jgi:hypothetical protein
MHSSISNSESRLALVPAQPGQPPQNKPAAPEAVRPTASDRPGVAQPVPARPIPALQWNRILPSALLILVTLLGLWEWHWRSFGVAPGYTDDAALWAIQRRRIDTSSGSATVLVGDSRTLGNLQLPVWERLSGRRPIQLGVTGASPLFAVEDLAADPKFVGKLVIGLSPVSFLEGWEDDFGGLDRFANRESLTQRTGKWLSMRLVEPWFAFDDPDYALLKILRRQSWPRRPGKNELHQGRKLFVTEADRNSYMWDKLETDPEYRAIALRDEAQIFGLYEQPPTDPKDIEADHRQHQEQIDRMVRAVAKLRARGVDVIFVRHPATGRFLVFENNRYPRAMSWDPILTLTGAPGVYFADYPRLQGYDLPDESHLSARSAAEYTAALYQILQGEHAPTHGRW